MSGLIITGETWIDLFMARTFRASDTNSFTRSGLGFFSHVRICLGNRQAPLMEREVIDLSALERMEMPCLDHIQCKWI